jgi:undecaprenyl-diphosphatase
VKDKREFRKGAIAWWVVAAVIAALLVAASFYLDGGAQAWMTAHRDLGMRSFMQAASRYGDWPEHIALGLVLVGLAYWRGNKRWMRIFTAMIVACALAGAVARVVKISTGRARPNVQTEAGWNGPRFSPHYNSFPSGHTAASTAFFATLAFAGWRFGFALLVVPLLIAFSRMYVAAHHLSDVVCAALIGLLAAYFIAHWMVPPIANCRRNE